MATLNSFLRQAEDIQRLQRQIDKRNKFLAPLCQSPALEMIQRHSRFLEEIERAWIKPLRQSETSVESALRRLSDEQWERIQESMRKLKEMEGKKPGNR